jgi:hypothetical protein
LFDIIVNFIIQKLKNKHTFHKKPQKVAKLSKAKFSRFEGTRGDKNQIFRTLVCSEKTLLSKEDVRLLLEDMKSDKLPSFSNFSKKRYSYYNEIHPKGDPNRRVTTPESTLYFENRIEYKC